VSGAFRRPEQLLPETAPADLRRLVGYWIALAAGRAMPAFADFDPVAVPWALSRLFVVQVVDGGADFVYRLAGERINERHGGSVAGRSVAELFRPGPVAGLLDRWRRVAGDPAACYTESRHPTTNGLLLHGRRVVMPLGPADGPVDHLIGMAAFEAPVPGRSSIAEPGVVDVRWVPLRPTAGAGSGLFAGPGG
jgi:hypothetical protein